MQANRFDAMLIRCLYLCEVLLLLFHMIGKVLFVTPLFYFTFLIVVVLFIRKIYKKMKLLDLICIFMIAISFICIILNSILCNSTIDFNYLKKFIMFAVTIMFFCIAKDLKINKYNRDFILSLIKYLSIFMIIIYIINPSQVFMLNMRVSKYLTFGLTNPNLTVLFLLCFTFVIFIELLLEEKIIMKTFYLIIGSFLSYFVYLTKSRNGILVLALFIILLIYMHFKEKKLKFNKWQAFFISIFPFIFSFLYMYFIDNKLISEVFGFLVEQGKGLDSRVQIWSFAINEFIKSPILGAYSQISNGTGVSQLHNSHLDVIASYGCISAFIFCYILYQLLNNKNKTYHRKADYLYTIGFAFSLLMGIGEAAVFAGGLGIYLFAGLFLLFRNE